MTEDNHRGIKLVLFLLLFGLYANWPFHTFTFDSLTYVLDVQSGQLSRMLHPHHLLYSPTSYCLWKVGRLFCGELHPLTVMRLFGALSMALAWLFLFKLLLEWEVDFYVSIGLSLLALLTYGSWRFASITEPYALHVFLIILLFYFASRSRRDTDTTYTTVPVTFIAALATLNLQTVFLFILPALVLALLHRKNPVSTILKTLLSYGLICIFFYFILGLVATGSIGALPTWFGKYAVDKRWWDPSPVKLITAIFAASDCVFGMAREASWWRVLSWIGLTAIIVQAMAHLRPWLSEKAELTYGAAISLLLQFGFYYQFDAGSPCYWTIVPPLVALLLAGPLTISARRNKVLTYSLLFSTMVIGSMTVFTKEVLPQSEEKNYLPYKRARLASKVVGNGTLWMMGGNIDERVFRLFTGLTINSIHDTLLSGKADKVHNLETLKERLNEDLLKGQVYVYGDIFNGSFKGIVGLDNKLISPNEIARAFDGMTFQSVIRTRQLMVWRLKKQRD